MATDIQLTEITDSTVFNSSDVMGNFNKLKLGITNVENGLSSLKLTDENIDVVAEDKKLSEVLPTVARKGEILPKDIKGNTDYIISFLLPNLTSTGELEYRFVNGDGSYKSGFTNLSNTYAKKTALESLQTSNSKEIESLISKISSLTNLIKDYKVAMDGYFSDLGTEVNRHANANNKLEELL